MKSFLFSLPVLVPFPMMGAVSYFEDFGAERADNVYPITDEGWSGFFSNTSTSGNASLLQQATGTTRGGLAEGTSWSGNTSAYLFIQNQATAIRSDFFTFTTTGVSFVPPATTTVSWDNNRTNFSFNASDSTISSTYYFALQIDSGSWYAVSTNYSSTNSVSFNLNTATFHSITFGGSGNPMSIDTGSTSTFATLLGSGQTVTGVGFYGSLAPGATGVTRTVRIDNLSIVPEPGSMALAGLSLLGLGLRRRR